MVSRVRIYISLKEGIVDREGEAIEKGLKGLGYDGIKELEVRKVIEFKVEEGYEEGLEEKVKVICDEYLVNKVLERYEYQIEIED